MHPPFSLKGFLSSGTPFTRGSSAAWASTHSQISFAVLETWGKEEKYVRYVPFTGTWKHYINKININEIFNKQKMQGGCKEWMIHISLGCQINQKAEELTGSLVFLTSFWSCSSSIFRMSLSDISRAILPWANKVIGSNVKSVILAHVFVCFICISKYLHIPQ